MSGCGFNEFDDDIIMSGEDADDSKSSDLAHDICIVLMVAMLVFVIVAGGYTIWKVS